MLVLRLIGQLDLLLRANGAYGLVHFRQNETRSTRRVNLLSNGCFQTINQTFLNKTMLLPLMNADGQQTVLLGKSDPCCDPIDRDHRTACHPNPIRFDIYQQLARQFDNQ